MFDDSIERELCSHGHNYWVYIGGSHDVTQHPTPTKNDLDQPTPIFKVAHAFTFLSNVGVSLSLYNSRSVVPKATYAKVTRTTFLQGHFISPSRSSPRSRARCRHFTIRGYSRPRSDPFKVTPAQGHSRPRSEDGDLGRRARTGQSLLLICIRYTQKQKCNKYT